MLHCIGASNHCAEARADGDFYATPPKAVVMLCEIETFSQNILEPSCGMGHISKELEAHGYTVDSRDLADRGYGKSGCDFLAEDNTFFDGDVVMNPPYSLAEEFVWKALSIIPIGHKVAAFLKLTFLEGKSRRKLFDNYPPVRVWVSSSRLGCGKNGTEWNPSAVAYCWFVWEKKTPEEAKLVHPEIRWFN